MTGSEAALPAEDSPADLFTTDLGPTREGAPGSRIVFLHGLFGQGKNWTQIARAFAVDHRVTLVDLPHHGRSSWAYPLGYAELADAVAAVLRVGAAAPSAPATTIPSPAPAPAPASSAREGTATVPAILVGHSMGGKVAMMIALRHPELVSRLCVVDIAPVDYAGLTSFQEYVRGMRALDLPAIRTRADAETQLSRQVDDPTVRGFLLQNLRRDPGPAGWRWQLNLSLLGDSLDLLSGWPADVAAAARPYPGPVLWVAGAQSRYIRPEYGGAMRALFPRTRLLTIKSAGHWVHSEQPEVFVSALRGFLSRG